MATVEKGSIDLCDMNVTFTAKDIVELQQVIVNNNIYTIEGLVEYFNNKFTCNKVIDFLKLLYREGIKLTPKLEFKPITEKCLVTNGEFKLKRRPLAMDDSYFINNLVVVRLFNEDGELTNMYEFYDDVDVDLNNLKCKLSKDTVNGIASVSYFTFS